MTIYVPGKLTLSKPSGASWTIIPEFRLPDEPEALDYIAAVEAADGQDLEPAVKLAYNTFIKGCKNDGIWDAIKASCILAGARTLDGALVPLAGATGPTKNGTEGGWNYNRETGLKGNGTDTYLSSNRANNADPQNSSHHATYITEAGTGGVINGGNVSAANNIYDIGNTVYFRNRTNGFESIPVTNVTGFVGHSRSNASNYDIRISGAGSTVGDISLTPVSDNVVLYQRNGSVFSTHRLSFYSIGESLDLALLDARVTTLMSDLAAAIP